jgi:hypothetical protein
LGSYGRQHLVGQGYDLHAFVIDWEAKQARCPQGQTSVKWMSGRDVSGDPIMRIGFDTASYRACLARQAYTWAKDAPRRLTVRPKEHHRWSRSHGNGSRPPTSTRNMCCGPTWRAASRKPRGALMCDGVAISGWPERICSSISLRRP